ncbi:glycosyltransferase family 69 protein [Hypoxylon sp. NC1633]|nr:glycosyltransferase family 69 protein [Hypoxylon sp. NC1633]
MPSSTSSRKRMGDVVTSASLLRDRKGKDLEAASTAESTRSEQTRGGNLLSWCLTRPRSLRRKILRQPLAVAMSVVKYIVMTAWLLLVGTPIFAPSYTRLPQHYRDLESRCQGPIQQPGCANINSEQVFISVSLYDRDGRLADGLWGQRLLELIHLLGHDNVFLSLYENDSGPKGAAALKTLRRQLRCRHHIVNDPYVSPEDFPTVTLPDETKRVKRLAYLSEIRNRALRPLDRFDTSAGTVKYDKILFLNDVTFRPVEAAHLLFSTNTGSDGQTHYLAACALDFWTPFKFYDVYVTRDSEGYSVGMSYFPFFSSAGKGISRKAMLSQVDAVPVQACWGGIVAMQAKYVQNMNGSLPSSDFQDISSHVVDPAKPHKVTAPVRFRYEPEPFYEACECCLFHADVAKVARESGEKELGVYINPYVRVAYKERVLSWLLWAKRWERLLSIPHFFVSYFSSLPTRNPYRTVQEGDRFTEEIWVGEGNAGHWKLVEREGRNGMFCGVRELQTIRLDNRESGDTNWENIKIPAGQILHFPT